MVRTDQISSSPLSGENYLCFLFFKTAGLTCLSLKERLPLFFFRFFSLLLVLANGFSLLLFLTNSFLSVQIINSILTMAVASRVSLSDLGFL
uniref:Uncharacterized protein n=2 Tax=Cyprinus carpio TaxID=7962 RepID=A0A9J8A342_CYPCA